MGDLREVGRLIGLIGGILAIALEIYNIYVGYAFFVSSNLIFLGLEGFATAISLFVGALLIAIYIEYVKIEDNLLLGLAIIGLGVLSNLIVVLGGIMIVLDDIL